MPRHLHQRKIQNAWLLLIPGVVASFVLLVPTIASAQETLLTPQELAKGIFEHDPALLRAGISVKRAELLVKAEEAAFTTELSASALYAHSETPVDSGFERGERVSDAWTATTGVSRRTQWGTLLSLQLQLTRTTLEVPQSFEIDGQSYARVLSIGPIWNQQVSFQLTQPLLQGAGKAFNTASIQTRGQSKTLAEKSKTEAASARLLSGLLLYYQLYMAQVQVEQAGSQLAFAESQREATMALIKSGSLADQEELVIARQIVALKEAKLSAEGIRRARSREIVRSIGQSNDVRAEVPAHYSVQSRTSAIEQMTAENPTLARLRENIKVQELRAQVTKESTLPQLNLVVGLGQSGLSEDFGAATEDTLGGRAQSASIGLDFRMPLDNTKAEREYDEARLGVEEAEIELEATRRDLELEVDKAYDTWELAAAQLELAQSGEALAKQNLEAEKALFDAGRSTNQNVIQFQQSYEEAQAKVVQIEVERASATVQILHLTGQLLATFGWDVQ